MKRTYLVLLLAVTAGVLIFTLYRPRRADGFATPLQCLDAYRAAKTKGDVALYWSCLGEPFRAETQRLCPDAQALAESLRQQMQGVKGWVVVGGADTQGPTTVVEVEEVYQAATRRFGFHVQRSSQGWVIVGIEPRGETRPAIPYGTHVSQVSEEAATKP